MKIYLVGGAVRDRLLNLPSRDHDWVVTGATPQQMTELGYKPVGRDFPVFLHPQTKEEYALARTEKKSGHGYHGFIFHTAADVTLEEDLLRRDLTVNAIAPGIVHTPMHGRPLEETEARHAGRIPLGRIGQPTDIVGAAVFLASKSANYITGQVLHVNGGMIMND